MNHNAIYALYPNAVTIDDSIGVTDKDGNKIEIDIDIVNCWVDPLEYQRKRASEYPPITDYLDGIVKGDTAQVQEYIDKCLAVKAKYPKGELNGN